MECHDVQQLLAFVQRKREELDAAERAAIRAHLDICPDCSARADAEQRADDTLGQVMRDVPVPAGLKQQVLNRLTAERGTARWATVKRGVAAAVLLSALAGGLIWNAGWKAEVTQADVDALVIAVNANGPWKESAARDYLKSQGLGDHLPSNFDFATLRNVEAFQFKGRRIAKLTFARNDDVAIVFVLPSGRFHIHETLHDDPTRLKIEPEQEITYLILFQGNLDALRPAPRLF
jgi:anti-sigma factor ChrR (cupin superfamily)